MILRLRLHYPNRCPHPEPLRASLPTALMIAGVGEPPDFGRAVGEPTELGGGEQPVGGRDWDRKRIGGRGVVHGPARVSYSSSPSNRCAGGPDHAPPETAVLNSGWAPTIESEDCQKQV